MMRFLLSAALAALALVPLSTAQAATRQFEPASQWRVDHEPQICRLSRDYSDGRDTISLRIEQFRPGAAAQLLLTGKPFARASFGREYDVRLGKAGKEFRAFSARITQPDRSQATLLPSVGLVPPTDTSDAVWPSEAALSAIDEIAFSAPAMGTIVLQTKTLARAMGEMRSCQERMVRGWGYDPAQQAALSRQPKPVGDPANWAQRSDYPIKALSRGRSSVIAFRLDIDASGKVTACHIPRSYTAEGFSEVTCSLLLQRARFEPARDAAGAAVGSFWTSQLRWLAM